MWAVDSHTKFIFFADLNCTNTISPYLLYLYLCLCTFQKSAALMFLAFNHKTENETRSHNILH